VKVGILGGTGPAGRALAARLADVGIDVVIGSRSAERGEEISAGLKEKWAGRDFAQVTGGDNEAAAEADIVIVATPWDSAATTAASVAAPLEGKVVISMANALARVGDEWSEGRISVAVEHRLSAICERVLARIAVHPRGRPRGVAVVCTPPGEEHSLPAAMAAVCLRSDRWQVHHLGTQVPAADLVALLRAVRADLLVLSLCHPPTEVAVDATAGAAAEAGVRVLVGGPGQTLPQLLQLAGRS